MNDLTWVEASSPSAAQRHSYAVFLVCGDIDQYGHNAVFAEEIGAALDGLGLSSRIVDYRREPRRVQSALTDPDCAFMVCFNGFGSELSLAHQGLGQQLISAFAYYRKPVIDLMHDCPSHDSMSHQVRVRDPIRRVLFTDYGYVQEAEELGFPNARFAPSITFPKALPAAPARRAERPIRALLPVQLPPADGVSQRFEPSAGYRYRVFHEIHEAVSEACIADLRADPRVETRRACREANIGFDPNNADHRFLLTGILDRVKFKRRWDLVRALVGLPVTLLTDGLWEPDLPPGLSTAPAQSFRELLATMTQADCVICPLPHMTGHHERALGAFTAGAAVVSAPNSVLETEFRVGQDLLMYRSAAELAAMLPDFLADHDRLRAIADAGRKRALERFSPRRLAQTMLSVIAATT
jgi:Glycosyl transferases group 1